MQIKKYFVHSTSVSASLKGNDHYCGFFFQTAICWLSAGGTYIRDIVLYTKSIACGTWQDERLGKH